MNLLLPPLLHCSINKNVLSRIRIDICVDSDVCVPFQRRDDSKWDTDVTADTNVKCLTESITMKEMCRDEAEAGII